MEKHGKQAVGVFDYFLVSGLTSISFKSRIVRKSSDSDPKNGDSLVFHPLLLHRFPENRSGNSWNRSIQSSLLQLCHPNDVSVRAINNAMEPRFHSFLSTRDDGFRSYGHVLTFDEKVYDKNFIEEIRRVFPAPEGMISNETFCTEKCICLISRLAYINSAEKILRLLYQIFVTEKETLKYPGLPIDSYIYNLLYEMPAPSSGVSIVVNWNKKKPIIITRPANFELPLLDVHLSDLFRLLGGALNVLRLLTSVFLEHQILLVSKNCENLMLVAEAITALMFPFQWLHTYAPVLPYKLAHNFLDAPVPYIMGIPLDSSENQLNKISSEFDQCFVDIDNGRVECPEGQPLFPNQSVLVKQLSGAYDKFVNRIGEDIDELTEENLISTLDTSVVQPSPPLHRRNAQKHQSKSTENNTAEKTSSDVNEELKNLHAVSTSLLPESDKSLEMEPIKVDDNELQQHLFNTRVREMIFGTFISLLSQYDKFVILPDMDNGEWSSKWFLTRESQQNFDKAAFLSDQAQSHLQFLSVFVETQAFVSLVDSSILCHMDNTQKDPNLKLFDDRIKQAKSVPRSGKSTKGMYAMFDSGGLSRSASIISAGQGVKLSIEKWIKTSEKTITKRYTGLSSTYPIPKHMENQECESNPPKEISCFCFPDIIRASFLKEKATGLQSNMLIQETVVDYPASPSASNPRHKPVRQPSISEFSPEMIAQTNWKFLEKLLKEVKGKTNRLVVRKMGHEAVALGHTEVDILGLEENTLIGSLCDLLERIWCHGLHANKKRGKSALWSHLLSFEEDSIRIIYSQAHGVVESIDGSGLLVSHPPIDASKLEGRFSRQSIGGVDRRYSQPIVPSNYREIIPVSTEIIRSIKIIRSLDEVRTDVGKCRAWIRLSLEQKKLQAHLKKLLLNRPLLQTLYKRYSLLRCDDEREQFLYHVLSLNAVEFSCFTNSFTKTAFEYRVWIFPRKQINGVSQTSANVHITLSGELRCTDKVSVPKSCTEFSFRHKNLGVITAVSLGHDNAGLLPRWCVDCVIVRNEFTGQAYFMPCGRWLGRGIDDGSTERLLLAQAIDSEKDLNLFIQDVVTGKVAITAPFLPQTVDSIAILSDSVGQAVNSIVKHLHSSNPNKLNRKALTTLLLKSNGLIPLLILIFQHGLKSSGVFRRQSFAWDVLTEVCKCLSGRPASQSLYKTAVDFVRNSSAQNLVSHTPHSRQDSAQSSIRCDNEAIQSSGNHTDRLVHLYQVIGNTREKGLGKDDMFQLLICCGLKERRLVPWMSCISSVILEGTSLYESYSFLLSKLAVSRLISVLENLSEYTVEFDPVLLRGADSVIQ